MIWRDKKQCYLPVLDADKQLAFFRYDKRDPLKENQYGIPEPVNRDAQIAAVDLDLVILPLLAFDEHGNRLGTGGGYYDRTFSVLHDKQQKKPFMLGVGYALQQADNLPADEWDIRLDGVLTEKGAR